MNEFYQGTIIEHSPRFVKVVERFLDLILQDADIKYQTNGKMWYAMNKDKKTLFDFRAKNLDFFVNHDLIFDKLIKLFKLEWIDAEWIIHYWGRDKFGFGNSTWVESSIY